MLVAIGLPGVSVITCNRCGKENQDHYKFCLGCGSELAKPAPAPTPSNHAPSSSSHAPSVTDSRDPALDRTVLPPAPMGAAVAGELRTASPAVPRARGGIPWGDSPKMPAPIPFHLPPNPLAATPPPRVTSANGGAGGIPAGATPAPMRVTGGPAPAAAAGEIPCPNCGKMVQSGFAFCGACGGRIGRQPSTAG